MRSLKTILFYVIVFIPLSMYGLDPILVTENTFKLNGEETLYYGFATGDQIIFDFQETKGKTVKEVEIVELPSNTKFQDFKTSGVNQKIIQVQKKGLYAFRFKNPAIAGRICKIKIQRIPADESKISFDTGWRYETVRDSTYVPYKEDSLVGYEQVNYTEYVKELISTEFEEYVLMDNEIIVRSKGIVQHDNPRAFVTFEMPSFSYSPLKEQKVVSWAFWLATGNNAESFWMKNKENMKGAANLALGISSPLGAFATGALVDLATPAPGTTNSVNYYVTDVNNTNLFMSGYQFRSFYAGSGSGACTKFTSDVMTNGKFCLCLHNPNLHERIKVTAKVSAIVETKTYQNVAYERVKSVPQYVTLHKKRLVVKTRQIMVMNGME